MSYEKLNILSQKIPRHTAHAIIKQIKNEVETMINFAMKFTDSKLPKVKEEAQHKVDTLLNAEIERLKQLQNKNATIRKEEIEYLEEQLHACTEVIANSKYELQAVRLVIAQ